MRVFLLIRSLEVGGAERQLGALAVGLKRLGHEVAVGVLYGGGALEAVPRAAGIPVIDLGKRGRWDVVRFGARAAREIRRFRPDVVHGYLVAANLVAVAARPFVPGARVVWGLRASAMDWSRYDRQQRVTFAVSRIASRWADLLIANSDAGARHHVEQGFPADKIRVVPNGIDLATWRPDRPIGDAQRAAWGVPPEARLFGIVARLDPMKDHATFLDAAGRVAASDPAARFVVVGGGRGPYAESLARHPAAGRLGARLVWAGEIEDMRAAYNALDVVVLSSTGESFPNAVAEAMACGVPGVVTDVGDAAALVGATGAVVPPRDPTALAAAMARVAAAAPPRAPRPDARERIASRYSVEAMCAATEALLAALVSGARPSRLRFEQDPG